MSSLENNSVMNRHCLAEKTEYCFLLEAKPSFSPRLFHGGHCLPESYANHFFVFLYGLATCECLLKPKIGFIFDCFELQINKIILGIFFWDFPFFQLYVFLRFIHVDVCSSFFLCEWKISFPHQNIKEVRVILKRKTSYLFLRNICPGGMWK